jgi:predicted O-methyltransferase YrrM
MDKKTIAFLKRKFPSLFSWVLKSPALSWLISELDRGRYIYCLLRNKVYFGTVHLAGQTLEERKAYMESLVIQEIEIRGKKDLNLLEIGSWAANSAVLWADAIKRCNGRGKVTCVDSFEPYIDENVEKISSPLILMNRALKKDKIFKLFQHNVRASRNQDIIHLIKDPSTKVLPLIPNESFDIIYIDGDHSYSGIRRDLLNAARILKNGGILCGDDFDLGPEPIDDNYAYKNRELNFLVDPKTKQSFHVGVCVAIKEFFNTDISSYNGFWVMRKSGDRWEKVEIKK